MTKCIFWGEFQIILQSNSIQIFYLSKCLSNEDIVNINLKLKQKMLLIYKKSTQNYYLSHSTNVMSDPRVHNFVVGTTIKFDKLEVLCKRTTRFI